LRFKDGVLVAGPGPSSLWWLIKFPERDTFIYMWATMHAPRVSRALLALVPPNEAGGRGGAGLRRRVTQDDASAGVAARPSKTWPSGVPGSMVAAASMEARA
jgi:hypothetical protein